MIHVNHCEHPNCWNGYLQVQPKQLWGYFNNDQLNKLFEIQGEYNENIAIVTISATCVDGSEAEVHPYDQLIAQEYTKRVYEMIEANPTGLDRLKYYALDVLHVASKEREFKKDVDFVLENGKIKWISQNRPGYDQRLNRGEAYSIAYYIRPIFYVHHVMKELRATQVFDPISGEKVAVRLPQHIMVLRELLVPDPDDKVGDATARQPRDGALPPR
jgi:hypothetical protein